MYLTLHMAKPSQTNLTVGSTRNSMGQSDNRNLSIQDESIEEYN